VRTDGALVTAFVESRDDNAFAELVRRHGPMVLATCRRVLHPDTHAADDAFQAAFLVLATKAAVVSPPERVGAWLHGVAVHVAKKARSWVRKIASLAPADLDKVPASATEPDLDLALLRRTIDDVLAGLPAKYRSPVVLCELEGRSRADAAQALGWTEGTLSGRLARAKKLLAGRLTRRGFALPSAGLSVLLAQPAAASVPAQLAASIMQAAALVAAGAAAAEVTSEPVATLAREGYPAMTSTFKILAASAAGLGLTLGGFGLFNLLDKPTNAAVPAAQQVLVNLPVAAPAQAEAKGWLLAHTFEFKHKLGAVAFGDDFVVAGDLEGYLVVFDAKTGKEREKILQGTDGGGSKPINSAQVSADGKWLFLITNDGEGLHGCTIEKKERKFPGFGGGANMKFVGFTPDGNYMLILRGAGKQLDVMENKLPMNLFGGLVTAHFKHEDAIQYAAAASPETVATITSPRAQPILRLWTQGKDKPVWETKLRDIENIDVTSVAVAPGGKHIAVAGDAGQLWLFDAANGKRIAKTDKLTGPVEQAAFSPDGKRIVAACEDKTARVYDCETGKELGVLKGHTDGVTCVAFSPDGEKIVTGSADRTVRVWEFKE
jgi:RNA polymerase sigma factor (sigma-70 family)